MNSNPVRSSIAVAGNSRGTDVAVKPQQPIPAELATLNALANELHAAIERLEVDLSTVTRIDPPTPDNPTGEPPRPPGILGDLEQIRRYIETAIARVNAQRDRLLL